ncbi:uncharacterized protein [Antedon mediterranea]|uniref:uncharacterized protein n=1 Tax=Antedon mediterranea TaxID=105859 RepID=UPI003AF64A5E
MSFFASNPFSSPVGQRIEKATNESLASEDWSLSIEICDIINESEDAHKEAMKAIKKKLVGNKKWKEVMYTLTLLETCVKNCGHRFHVLICKQDFIKELVKIIQPSSNPPTLVQEKILALIQSWADAFRALPDLQGVVKVYEELRTKGIEFPATDLDTLAPIITPERSVPELDPAVSRPPSHNRQAPQMHHHPSPVVPPAQLAEGPVNLSPEQLVKMQKDLEVVQGNYRVFSEMLTEMTPGQENPGDLELLQELNRTCRSMQSRVVHLLNKVSNEEVTGELLRINDDLNNVFVRYDRFERYRQQTQPSNAQSQQPAMTGLGAVNPPAYQVSASSPAYRVGAPPASGPGYPTSGPGYPAGGQGYPTGGPGYPTGAPGYPAGGPGYPAGGPGYPTGGPGYSTGGPGYPAGGPGYPAGGPGYPAGGGAPAASVPAYANNMTSQSQAPPPAQNNSSVGTLISFDDEPVTQSQPPNPAVGQLSEQLAGLGMGGSSVSNTLGQLQTAPPGQLQTAPPAANQANTDDFDMFALSRQTAYQDPVRGGSTYQDNSNMDQTSGGLANAMNSRAVNPFSTESQAISKPETNNEDKEEQEELPADFSQLENMEQWLQESDLSKPVDSTAAANTNPEGITSSAASFPHEFDKFLEERAAAGDSLQGSTVNRGGRQLKMEETENTMFSL